MSRYELSRLLLQALIQEDYNLNFNIALKDNDSIELEPITSAQNKYIIEILTLVGPILNTYKVKITQFTNDMDIIVEEISMDQNGHIYY